MPFSQRVFHRMRLFAAVGLLLSTAEATLGAEKPGIPDNSPTLRLTDGSFVTGRLQDSANPDIFRWQSPAFVGPFDFARQCVSAIHYPAKGQPRNPQGAYCFELAGGDMLFGSLVSYSAEMAELDLIHLGRVHLKGKSLRRLQKWDEQNDLIFHGPNGLVGWENGAESGWTIDSGHLRSNAEGAVLFGDFGLPARVCIELELSWSKKPDFVLELGVENGTTGTTETFRIEPWEKDLVVLRETESTAQIVSLMKISSAAGRIGLRTYLDQEHNRLLVLTSDGKRLADIDMPDGKPSPVLPGIRLTNKRGDIRLERLRISRWNGEVPQPTRSSSSSVHLADGTLVGGTIKGFDARTKHLIVGQGDAETRIDLSKVAHVDFGEQEEIPRQSILVILQDGTRLSGELTKIENGKLWLKSPAIVEPVSLPIEELRTVAVLNHEPSAESAKATAFAESRMGCFQTQGVRLAGSLANGQGKKDASCLVWRPRGSFTTSPLRTGQSGRIVYREIAPKSKADIAKAAAEEAGRRALVAMPPRIEMGAVGLLIGIFNPRGRSSTAIAVPAAVGSSGDLSLYLRTGDSIPGRVTKIDEKGLHFETKLSGSLFVPHARIKAVNLAHYNGRIKVDKEKLLKLLTVPRMRKNNPPTHIIRSCDGDYIRGRLVMMDDEHIHFEVRLETKEILRSNIARIIWLHEDEWNPQEGVATNNEPLLNQIQAIRTNGTRLTFRPEKVATGIVFGSSDLLGPCHADLTTLDQLLIGNAIEEASDEIAYHQWVLKHAIEPRFLTAGDGASKRASGMESDLVGQTAPDFKLELLDGDEFRLSDQQGKVVVLDFWATWCGPCIQAMPTVDRVVREFADQDVRLVAVNLREGPKEIKATLDRLELDMTVALDQDGVAAERYNATAIPQTVIIDRDGKVVRLFVGGEAIEERLRESLTAILGEPTLVQGSSYRRNERE